MPSKKTLICVVGPTAIGKTSMAIAIAKAFATEIISADSRQFYKEMKIGTAVPSPSELAEVTHHFIQSRSIFDSYSVGNFEKETINLLDELFLLNDVVVMVGGSGLYMDAVVKGLDIFPEVNANIRAQLNEELRSNGIEALQNELKSADPNYFLNADINNPHRLIRALEIYRSSGKPMSSFLKRKGLKRNFKAVYIGLRAEREIIYERINKRVDLMIDEGLIVEAKKLYQHKELNALQTVGYRELFEYFEDVISLEEAIEEIKKNTRRFSKRQGTWFRKNEDIHWFEHTTSPSEIINYIKEKNALT